jgi:exonuclease III
MSERNTGCVSEIKNYLGNLPKLICGNIHSEKNFSSSNGKTKIQNKPFYQSKGSVPLTVYHQNVRGLGGKVNELLSQSYPTYPHVLCLSEHHKNYLEFQRTSLDCYSLGADYCRTSYTKGGVCILEQDKLRFVNIDLAKFCKDKDFEVCAIKIYLETKKICIIAIYRAPSGNFDIFISNLDSILKKLFTVTVDFIICGDININFLVDSDRKSQLEALLKTYNLTSVVNFPTRIQQNSATAIDNIFIDITRYGNYSISPIVNGLSDHDAQIITLNSISVRASTNKRMPIRKINEYTINDFLLKLSFETWDTCLFYR